MSSKNNDIEMLEGGRRLPLVEDFYTIQGEGFHAGKPAYFIRLGGCGGGWVVVGVMQSILGIREFFLLWMSMLLLSELNSVLRRQ